MLLVTSTETVQVEAPTAAFTPGPPTMKVAVPAVGVPVGAPPQPLTTFGVPAITTPAGRLSVKVSALRAGDPAGLVTVNVSVEVCPTPIVVALNALVSTG